MPQVNVPRDLDYVSTRLCGEIISQESASPSLRESAFGVKQLGFTWTSRRRDPDHLSRTELAGIATELVSDQIGTLGQPGDYVHLRLSMRVFSFPILLGFEDSTPSHLKPFGGFYASCEVPEIGPCFVALFGSLANFRGYEPQETGGWTPSDAIGLYNLIASFREPPDLRPNAEYMELSNSLERPEADPDHNIVARAAVICTVPDLPAPAMHVELLAKSFWLQQDVQAPAIGAGYPKTFEVAMVGTPIWAAIQP